MITDNGDKHSHKSEYPFWAAPEIASAGYPVFPTSPTDKKPSVEGGFYTATRDHSQIAEWIEEGRETHGVATPTGVFSGMVVVEADTPERFAEMQRGYGPPTVKTRKGGHWYFRHPRNGKVLSNNIREGLDRKGDGGYVLVPPSLGRYWTDGIPRLEDLPALPREFWTRRKAPTEGERTIPQERKDGAMEAIAKHVRSVAQGQRHEHLRHLCGVLLGRELSLADAADILGGAWAKVGGELSERADSEVPNTLATTQAAMAEGRATGVPSMEKITPGLYDELAKVFGWIRIKATDSTNPTNPTNPTNLTNPLTQPITAWDLMDIEFPPTVWVVPDVVPEGLSLLAGKPKKGKSWMILSLCVAVSTGGRAFGIKQVEQGDTLYLALEDNRKRLKKRLKKVLGDSPAPKRMHLHTEWPRLDEGGAEELDRWLTSHPEARLVAIDTLARIRNPARGQNVYAEDYAALGELLPLAAKHGVAIVVVHHLRKGEADDPQDTISGSTGLTGGVDGYMVLQRTRGGKGPTLYVDGRDIEDPIEYALSWNINTATWTIEGEAGEVHLSKERADILLTLNRARRADPPKMAMTPKEVSDITPGAKYNNIKFLMWAMYTDGQLRRNDKGEYWPTNPTNPPTNPTNPTNSGKRDTYAGNGNSVSGVSGVGKERPLSADLPPGESASLTELRELRTWKEQEVRNGHGQPCPCHKCSPKREGEDLLTGPAKWTADGVEIHYMPESDEPTQEQQRRIDRLVSEGMSEDFAREAVLGIRPAWMDKVESKKQQIEEWKACQTPDNSNDTA